MLAARMKEAGMPYKSEDFKAFQKLENGEVDAKLEEIAKYKAGWRDGKKPEAKQKPKEVKLPKASKQAKKPKAKAPIPIDKIRFGLAAKLVVQQNNIRWCINEREEFSKVVLALYHALMEAEAEVSASSSSSQEVLK